MMKHIHRYKRVNLSRDKSKSYIVFKCVHHSCSHYVPVHLAEGKLCECNRCGEQMILTKESIILAKPHCSSCVKRKKRSDVEKVTEFLSKIIP